MHHFFASLVTALCAFVPGGLSDVPCFSHKEHQLGLPGRVVEDPTITIEQLTQLAENKENGFWNMSCPFDLYKYTCAQQHPARALAAARCVCACVYAYASQYDVH